MIAHKFLSPGAVGLYSGFPWPQTENGEPGAWVEVEGPLIVGLNGVHACSDTELVNWIDDELWLIELDGEIELLEGVLVARRGRLIDHLEDWNVATAKAFAYACVLSARDHAVRALQRDRRKTEAEELAALNDLDDLQARAVADADDVTGFAATALAFVADAVELARGGRPENYGAHPGASVPPTQGAIAANLGFVVAHAAGCAAADAAGDTAAYDSGFAAERNQQREWLADRLHLTARTPA